MSLASVGGRSTSSNRIRIGQIPLRYVVFAGTSTVGVASDRRPATPVRKGCVMRRLVIGCAATALLLGGGALAGSTAVQATTPPSEAPEEDHPIVGAWLLTVDEFPEDPPELIAFHADGTYQQASADGTSGIGSWEATGPSSINLTFVESRR